MYYGTEAMCYFRFFTVKEIETSHGTERLKKHKDIAKHYLSSWFVIDFCSILPFDTVLGRAAGRSEALRRK